MYKIFIDCHHFAVVGIGFTNEVFQVEENQLFAEVCAAVINGTLERKVIVSLTTENGSAHGQCDLRRQESVCVSVIVTVD